MRKLFCDRCGEEMKVAYIRMWIGFRESDGLELCETCSAALDRFMEKKTTGGGTGKTKK